LFVLATPCRQAVADFVERFAEARDVAVAEDREGSPEQKLLTPVDRNLLGEKMTHESLSYGQPDRIGADAHGLSFSASPANMRASEPA
jgi:hypothetical protein